MNEEITNLILTRENINCGTIKISLYWEDHSDLDLFCETPFGEKIFYGNPKSKCGGQLDTDMNSNSTELTNKANENITWDKSPNGKYKVYVYNFKTRNEYPYVQEYVPFKVRLIKNEIIEWYTGKIRQNQQITCFEFVQENGNLEDSFIVLPFSNNKLTIKQHCELHKLKYIQGTGYYQMTKTEKIHNNKNLMLHNIVSDSFIIGREDCLEILNLPKKDKVNKIDIKTIPKDYILYIQSIGLNRTIPAEKKILIKVPIEIAVKYNKNNGIYNDKIEETLCGICLLIVDKIKYLRSECCKNIFHIECFNRWKDIKNQCSLCRSSMQTTNK